MAEYMADVNEWIKGELSKDPYLHRDEIWQHVADLTNYLEGQGYMDDGHEVYFVADKYYIVARDEFPGNRKIEAFALAAECYLNTYGYYYG